MPPLPGLRFKSRLLKTRDIWFLRNRGMATQNMAETSGELVLKEALTGAYAWSILPRTFDSLLTRC